MNTLQRQATITRTTKETEYTFEDALINQGNNRQVLEDQQKKQI